MFLNKASDGETCRSTEGTLTKLLHGGPARECPTIRIGPIICGLLLSMSNQSVSNHEVRASQWLVSRAVAIKIALTYAVLAGLWILCSDWALHALMRDQQWRRSAEIGKGWLFVISTALLLGWYLDRYFHVIRRAAEKLDESEQRWGFALAGAGDGVWDFDAQTNQVFFSDRWKTMLGYAPHEIGNSFAEWESRVHTDDLPGVKQEMEKHLRGETSLYQTEHRLRCKDGSYKFILARGCIISRSADGRPLRVVGTHRDVSERHAAEQALRASEAHFRALFEAMNEGVALHELVCDEQGKPVDYRILRVNPAFERHTGFKPESTEGRLASACYGVTPAPFLDTYAAVAQGGAPVNFDTFFAPIGRHFVVSVFSPRPGTFATVFLDVTERKLAEAAAAEEAVRRQILVEQSSDGILVVGEDGAVVETNLRFAEMLGYSVAEIQQLHVWDWDLQWSREELLRIIRAIGPQGTRFVTRQRRKDGRVIDVEVGNNGATLGGRKLVFCVCRDISDRKQAEDALKSSEDRFRRVVEAAPQAIFIRRGRHCAYANPAAVKLFGAVSAEELVGKSMHDCFHPSCRAEIEQCIRQLDDHGTATVGADVLFQKLDGQPVPVIVSAFPFPYQGQPAALVFARDRSGERLLEAQLRQAQKLEAIGQLAGGVAHDFNNILAVIMVNVGLMKLQPRLSEEMRRGLNELEIAADRAAGLTRQLLMFGRRSVLAMKPLDVNDLVANLLKMLSRLLGERVNLSFDPGAALPAVQADAGMIEQVLMNLAVNARDAMPGGGRITLTTELRELGPGELAQNGERHAGSFVVLSVADTGSGIEDATLKHLFEPFFTTKEPGKGTGLGLATVHGIIAQHNGWIEVDSTVGRGTTFTVFLPALPQQLESLDSKADAGPMLRGCETVLVVEDETRVREVIGQSLRVLGYRVFEADGVEAALAHWERHKASIDLLLTDMVMPGPWTGLELAEHLQKERPALKVVVSSGYSAEIVHAGVPDRPGIAYLAKPYQVHALARFVRHHLDASKARRHS